MDAVMRALITCAAAVTLSLIHAASAADYVVGSPDGGWDGRTNYKSWAEAQTFAPGDTLTFNYNSYHNVLEVTKQSFDECTTTNPVTHDTSGSTTVLLTMPGKRYFICGAPGHCLNGMKMEIEVADRPAPTTPSPPPLVVLPPPLVVLPPPDYAIRRPGQPAPAPTTMALTPAWAPAPRPRSPAPAPAPSRRVVVGQKKKHKKRYYCPPVTAPARARTTVQSSSVEEDFPEAAFAPMSSPPTSAGGPALTPHRKVVMVSLAAALGGFMLVAL